MPSKVIVLRPTINFDHLMQKLPDNDPAAWMFVTMDARAAVDAPDYFRKEIRHLQTMASIHVTCVEETDKNGDVVKWAERSYRVVGVDLAAQIVEVAPAGDWRTFGRAAARAVSAEPPPQRERARA